MAYKPLIIKAVQIQSAEVGFKCWISEIWHLSQLPVGRER
jgi:hypothetical protein